jgi:hypothetical protein
MADGVDSNHAFLRRGQELWTIVGLPDHNDNAKYGA